MQLLLLLNKYGFHKKLFDLFLKVSKQLVILQCELFFEISASL